MLKYTAGLVAAAAIGAGVEYGASEATRAPPVTPPPPPSLKPPLSQEALQRVNEITKGLIDRHAGESYVYTSCAQNCMTSCITKVYSKNGKITSIVSDDSVNAEMAREDAAGLDAIKKGHIQNRACAMGYAWEQMVYKKDRLLYPMKLVGAKGSGKYARISWTEALDTISQKMKEAKEKYGPYSILNCTFGNTLFSSLIECGIETWGDQSNSGNQPAEILAEGSSGSTSPGASSQADMFNAKLVIMLGRLPTVVEGQCGTWGYVCLLAKENGVKFISIDPRYTVDSQALGSQWIPIRPGTDVALLFAMANVLFKEDLYDKAAVEKWIEPTGFGKWKDYIMGAEDGVEKTPEWAEKICGIPADTIRSLTRVYAENKPTKLYLGWEMNRPASLNISRAAVVLQAMMGYLLVPGGGGPFEMGYGKNPWMNGPAPFPDTTFAAFAPRKWNVPTAFNLLKWQKAILLREKLDKGEITAAEFNGLIGMHKDDPPPNIKVVTFPIAMKNHPTNQFGASERLRAMKKVFSWGSYWYTTSSALYMDILLPAVERFMEAPEEGLAAFGGAANRFLTNGSSMQNCFIYASPAVEPLGEARPEEWVYIMLAKRFGVADQYNPVLSNVLAQDEWDWKKWNDAIEASHKRAYEGWMKDPKVVTMNPPTWEEFKKKPVWRYDAVTVGPYARWLGDNKNPFDTTPSKKIEVYCDMLSDPKKAAATKWGNDYGYTGACFGKIGPGAGPIPKYVENLEYTIYDPKSNDYPLLLITPQSYYRSHSSGFWNPLLHGDCYRHAVWISVADAKVRNISDGDLVKVYSDVGEMMIPAYVTSKMTPGVVAIYHGGLYTPNGVKTNLMPDGIDRGGAPNLLIEDVQPGKMVVGPDIGSGPVQVEKL